MKACSSLRKRVCYYFYCVASIRVRFIEWNGETHNILCYSMAMLGKDAWDKNVYTILTDTDAKESMVLMLVGRSKKTDKIETSRQWV